MNVKLLLRWALGGVLLVSVVCGCARKAPDAETELIVFGAASLQNVFESMAKTFEREQPGAQVTFNFAGSAQLRTQLEQGARADVFACADHETLTQLQRSLGALPVHVFASNEPVLVVAKDKASTIRSLGDLVHAERIVLGASEVPIGRYSEQILKHAAAQYGAAFRASVESKVVSRELNVRQVLTKVSLGEADAGIVYRSDTALSGSTVVVVEIPSQLNVLARYPISVLPSAPHPRLAQAWLTFVLSERGQQALQAAGFGGAALERSSR